MTGGGKMRQRAERTLAMILTAAGAIGAIWLSARFLLPWAAPFLVAYALAALLEMPLRVLLRHGWRRRAAAGLLSVCMLAGLLWGTAALAWKGIGAITDFAKQTPELMALAGERFRTLEGRTLAYAEAAPEGVREYLTEAVGAVGDGLYELPGFLSQKALDLLAKTAQASPNILLFAVTAGIGTYFISAAFPRTNAFIAAQLPESFRKKLSGLGRDLRGSFGGFMRSQIILMTITFFELLVAFFAMKIDGAPGIAAVTAVVDALPVFGTGTVLIPWALYCLLIGRTGRAAGLLAVWAATNIVRNCIQAKLLGDQIGLDPLASLLAIYVGWRVCGVLGMLSFPILLVTLQQLNDRGVIKLWKDI